ncbi:hypothetical protein SAMN05421736_110112 [Evansella caseinilytica]|uniref:Matrixin n=1 Tax=Evansella caseinilytica TaxID=1503961 RepID=A0A1H3SAI4_9BACI|nr:hypothetical protein [Evansella caseinilytica]SDZ35113.1 hypothetical protein SAMN05421736_110112 [Evansella caseinilytica]
MTNNFNKMRFFFFLAMLVVLINTTSVDAYYTGRKPENGIIYVELGSVDQKYRNSWTSAFVNWSERNSYRSIRYRSGSSNLMTAQYDSSRPNAYGRIVYNNSSSKYTTPFRTYLNTYRSQIVNNSNVRISTASHEIGHALGLADLEDSSHSIMNTKRDRTTLIYATSRDISRVNAQ